MQVKHEQKLTGTTQDTISAEQMEHLPLQKVGIAVSNASNPRLLETIAASLELESSVVEVADLKAGQFPEFEVVIAGEEVARELRPIVAAEQIEREQSKPALIAFVSGPRVTADGDNGDESFDAVLTMPETPSLLTASEWA